MGSANTVDGTSDFVNPLTNKRGVPSPSSDPIYISARRIDDEVIMKVWLDYSEPLMMFLCGKGIMRIFGL